MKKIYGYVVLTVLLLGIATALETKATDGKVKIFPIEACYAMDVYNPVEVVKEADYVFAGHVESVDGSLIVSGANSNIEINESNLKSVAAIKSAKEYKIYEKAVKQQTADTESLKNDMQNK